MKKLKCLIIDDDPLITDLVMHFSEKSEMIEFCISCNDPVEGLKLLSNSSFDILFLDYNMPVLNGQDLLDIKKDKSKVIMITSNSQFAVDSYDYEDVIDFMVKPLDYERFQKAISKFKNRVEPQKEESNTNTQTSVIVKDGSNWVPIAFESISYIKSESNYCTFYTKDGKIMSLAKLKELEEKLPSNFIRCHRSYIINTNYISKVNLEEVVIENSTLPISAMYKEEIKKFLQTTN